MSLFSQRRGLTPIRKKIQIDSIDGELKIRLWNVCKNIYWDQLSMGSTLRRDTPIGTLVYLLWQNLFKKTLDDIIWNRYWQLTYDKIRGYYFSYKEWYEIYNFIEFIADNYEKKDLNQSFMDDCNKILEEESSAYRFVGRRITQITSEEEISEIEEALVVPLDTVKTHIKTALDLLSDRNAPDYRNSIKESISAVEAICRLIARDEKATLGKCLNKIEENVELHRALRRAFSSLYGYTSTAEGIRHALLDEPTLSFEDAKFMLVSCSAFVNYLISKASKAGIDFN